MGDAGPQMPAAVLQHRSVVRIPRALITDLPLRKQTCQQPMRRCPATHTCHAYTRMNANTLANGAKHQHAHTHTHTTSEPWAGLLRVQRPGANPVCQQGKKMKSKHHRQTGWTSSSLMEESFSSVQVRKQPLHTTAPHTAHTFILQQHVHVLHHIHLSLVTHVHFQPSHTDTSWTF